LPVVVAHLSDLFLVNAVAFVVDVGKKELLEAPTDLSLRHIRSGEERARGGGDRRSMREK
jgi:hypothetical protein